MPIDALSVLCAQFTRDLLAIAKFLSFIFLFFQTNMTSQMWPTGGRGGRLLSIHDGKGKRYVDLYSALADKYLTFHL